MSDLISFSLKTLRVVGLGSLVVGLFGCGSNPLPQVPDEQRNMEAEYTYVIGPGDSMEVFVWGNEELTVSGVEVRPDGKISTRLVENIEASGKTPSQLARDIEEAYSEYVKSAVVSVIVNNFEGVPSQQVRVVGEAAEPLKVPFRKHMTLLDLMVEVGGLTEFADGNKAVLIRNFDDAQSTYNIRLADLLKDGDISANVALFPGDIVIIPEAWF
ncbi:MAG: polysaccharide export protein [Porticoccus sp.]|nr:polysaccharide export protein [Porticoccus sp.]